MVHLENMILVRNLKKNIGYEGAVLERLELSVHKENKQIEALDL